MSQDDLLKWVGANPKLVKTEDGSLTVFHEGYSQAFHSYSGAAKEAHDLYVLGSGFAEALGRQNIGPLSILDVGLGLGYNAKATIEAWLNHQNPPDLKITSLEYDDGLVSSLALGTSPWQQGWSNSSLGAFKQLKKNKSNYECELGHACGSKLKWEILVGDALKKTLFTSTYDYIWQDPFSPEVNPLLWSAEWFNTLKNASKPDCVLATYSVSRVTKDALSEGGWDWERIETTTSKRHWLLARPKRSISTT